MPTTTPNEHPDNAAPVSPNSFLQVNDSSDWLSVNITANHEMIIAGKGLYKVVNTDLLPSLSLVLNIVKTDGSALSADLGERVTILKGIAIALSNRQAGFVSRQRWAQENEAAINALMAEALSA